jgi:N-acetylmuramoyl-L-alanine amidase
MVTIVLDPGHGGEDPGAIGRGGSYEKNVTLSVAQRLKRKIDATPGMRSVLTRDGDYFVPLHQRVRKARRVRADLFVSIHADAFVKPTRRAALGLRPLRSRRIEPRRAGWRNKENDADLVGGVNLGVKDLTMCAHPARPVADRARSTTASSWADVLGDAGPHQHGCTSRMWSRPALRC